MGFLFLFLLFKGKESVNETVFFKPKLKAYWRVKMPRLAVL